MPENWKYSVLTFPSKLKEPLTEWDLAGLIQLKHRGNPMVGRLFRQVLVPFTDSSDHRAERREHQPENGHVREAMTSIEECAEIRSA